MIYAFIGVLAGICSGLFGIGGGVIIVPALVYFAGVSQHTASGTSMVALLLPVGALAVWQYYSEGRIGNPDIVHGLIIGVGVFAGAYVGARLGLGMSELMLRRAFAVFLALVAARLFLSTLRGGA